MNQNTGYRVDAEDFRREVGFNAVLAETVRAAADDGKMIDSSEPRAEAAVNAARKEIQDTESLLTADDAPSAGGAQEAAARETEQEETGQKAVGGPARESAEEAFQDSPPKDADDSGTAETPPSETGSAAEGPDGEEREPDLGQIEDGDGAAETEPEPPKLREIPNIKAVEPPADEDSGTEPEAEDGDGRETDESAAQYAGPEARPRASRLPAGLRDRRRLTAAAGIFLVLAVIVYGIETLRREQARTESASVTSPPVLDPTPGGEVQQRSPEYQGTLETANDAGTAAAIAQSGETFLPTPEDIPSPVGEPSPPPGVPRDAGSGTAPAFEAPPPLGAEWSLTAEAAAGLPPPRITDSGDPFAPPLRAPPPAENPMLAYLEALAAAPHPVMGGARADAGGAQGALAGLPTGFPSQGAAPAAPVPAAAPDVFALTGLRPGDILDAAMINSLNSDIPGPAFAEITDGRLRGARLAGIFTPYPEAGGLALTFSRLILPDGRSLPVEAYGLSPWTGQSLTRSRLEPRALRRIGIPSLTAMLTGAASAAADGARHRLTAVGDSLVIERPRMSDRMIIAAGITAGAAAAGNILSESAPRAPRILLAAGSPVLALLVSRGGRNSSAPAPASPAASGLPGLLLPGAAGPGLSGLPPTGGTAGQRPER